MTQNKVQDAYFHNKISYQSNLDSSLKQLKPSSNFLSKSQRFSIANDSISPGPAAYLIPNKDIRNLLFISERTSLYRKKIKQKNQTSAYSKQYLWIIEDRFKTLQEKAKHLGPGLYNPQQSKHLINNSNWGKSKRFKQKGFNTAQHIGPGAYQIQISGVSSGGAQSAFKSKTPKFIEQKLNPQSLKSVNMEPKLFRSNQYKQNLYDLNTLQLLEKHRQNIQNLRQKKKLKSYVFSSNLPRFRQDKMSKLGPGCYSPNEQNQQKNKKQLKHRTKSNSHFSTNQTIISKTQSYLNASYIKLNQNPGPNQYNVDQFDIEKRLKNSQKCQFSKQTRFNFRKRKAKSVQQIPGPGHYNQKKFVYLQKQMYFNPLKKINNHKIAFLTGEGPNPSQLSKYNQKQPFGYNSNISDIQNRILKKKNHIQKLKLMDVQVAPFNSKQKRF